APAQLRRRVQPLRCRDAPRRRGSQTERISVAVAFVRLVGDQRFEGRGLVEPGPGVELLGQDRLAVMAPALALGAVDHADETLQSRFGEAPSQGLVLAGRQVEQEARYPAVVAGALVGIAARGQDPLGLV